MLGKCVRNKIPFTWRKQNVPSCIFKAKYNYCKQTAYSEYSKNHLAQHLKMSAKSHHSIIFAIFHYLLCCLFLYYDLQQWHFQQFFASEKQQGDGSYE